MPKVPRDTPSESYPERSEITAETDSSVPTQPSPSNPKPGRTPWRLEVVEAWFERARRAGLETAEERLRQRRKARQDKDTSE